MKLPDVLSELSPAHITAGFVAVLVGFTSSVVIIIQAAQSAGASPAEVSSWIWALGLGMGVTSIGLSLAFREPVLTAWSTPGAALLVTSLPGVGLAQATGAFLFCGLLIFVSGFTGWFERLLRFIPQSLAAAMLAGILFQFGLNAFAALDNQLMLVGIMFVTYLLGRQFWPRYTIPVVLVIGVMTAALQGQVHLDALDLALARPIFTTPVFSVPTLISVGLPLFIVTMTSQNMPGLATLRANGYQTRLSPTLTVTGLVTLVLAPFGCFALNLAAITAAICMGDDAGDDRDHRYLAAVCAGLFYLAVGLFGATVVALFAAFPQAFVTALAGLALLGTIGNSLHAALDQPGEREAALVTFLITASGLSMLTIGSAFWGIVGGLMIRGLQTLGRQQA